ncbi:hypothetical protein I302_103872 [Kwoniella bestiolae CBS 10118]|uniref:Uncharacterized protein n=1 Tax=Kwoniella bestiolae CBS 10118 TaxID=1296100 RepID=A0A1B9G9P6_9TREE|nr:hypothetical protein I302_02578 [Kwoniella bestiolae CBS 10118]OCF27733.1 hypothetical protein I302_02578 [Kwoniella bestiolae CBS 10118]
MSVKSLKELVTSVREGYDISGVPGILGVTPGNNIRIRVIKLRLRGPAKSMSELLEAQPPYTEEMIKTVPSELDLNEHLKFLDDKWGDSVLGAISTVEQPEDGTILVPVFTPVPKPEPGKILGQVDE